MKIRKWDLVQVMSWKSQDKWKQAKVLNVNTKEWKIIVEWINIATKHIKKSWTNPWQIIKVEKAIDVSNVMLVCPFTKKPTRVWIVKIEEKWKSKNYRFSKNAVKELKKEAKEFILK